MHKSFLDESTGEVWVTDEAGQLRKVSTSGPIEEQADARRTAVEALKDQSHLQGPGEVSATPDHNKKD